jgi:hypothetical protein
MKLTAMLAPETAREGVLHAAVEVDTHLLISHVLEATVITPDPDTVPNIPVNETNLAPVVGKLEVFTRASMGALNERKLETPDPATLAVVTTKSREVLAASTWSRALRTESEVQTDLREALPNNLAWDERDTVPKLFPKTVTTTDPVTGEFVLLILDNVGASKENLWETDPIWRRTVTNKLSEAAAPAVTLTEVSESLLQQVNGMDDTDNMILTLLSLLARLEPTIMTVELPLEGTPDSMKITAGAGALNEIADENTALTKTPTEAVVKIEAPEPCAKRVYNDEWDIQTVAEQCDTKRQLGDIPRDANDRPVNETWNCPVVGPNASPVTFIMLGESKVIAFVTEPCWVPTETLVKCNLENPCATLQTVVESATQDVAAHDVPVRDARGDWSTPNPAIWPKIVTEVLPVDKGVDAETLLIIGLV